MATISNNDIARAIYLHTKDLGGSALDGAIKKSVVFLARRNLLGKSADILKSLQKMVYDEAGALEVKVSSKDKLSEESKKEISSILKKRYGDKELIWQDHIDETVLGGFKLEIKDELIDMTLKSKIKNLQKHLIEHHE